MAWAANKA
jgi:hypothetical protein